YVKVRGPGGLRRAQALRPPHRDGDGDEHARPEAEANLRPDGLTEVDNRNGCVRDHRWSLLRLLQCPQRNRRHNTRRRLRPWLPSPRRGTTAGARPPPREDKTLAEPQGSVTRDAGSGPDAS